MWSDIVRIFLTVVLSIAFLVFFGQKNIKRYQEGGIAKIRDEEDMLTCRILVRNFAREIWTLKAVLKMIKVKFFRFKIQMMSVKVSTLTTIGKFVKYSNFLNHAHDNSP